MGRLVVVARGLYLARHLFTLLVLLGNLLTNRKLKRLIHLCFNFRNCAMNEEEKRKHLFIASDLPTVCLSVGWFWSAQSSNGRQHLSPTSAFCAFSPEAPNMRITFLTTQITFLCLCEFQAVTEKGAVCLISRAQDVWGSFFFAATSALLVEEEVEVSKQGACGTADITPTLRQQHLTDLIRSPTTSSLFTPLSKSQVGTWINCQIFFR